MNLLEETKTKRIYVRLTPSDHSWLMGFASRRETTVSKLFRQFIEYLRAQELIKAVEQSETEEEHADPDVSL